MRIQLWLQPFDSFKWQLKKKRREMQNGSSTETQEVQVQEPVRGKTHSLCFANKAAMNQRWWINIQIKSLSSSVSTFIF